MKKMLLARSLRVLIFACLLVSITVALLGCAGTGQTRAETQRNHSDVVKTNWGMMQDDLDAIFMLDKPSRLSSRYVR
ncbi:MAG TPA: hypothetical protein P5279_15095 [Anaerohalosphaeraceae bacterium]|jgi:hypothetical protein|nr:hypothetical protein [Anaerohalosphaeraceae bacterium]HRT51813.1 hypothetical protein [Anaerohalosphaeraceae bacterium]HRT87831.1 hypothetical protein [Anaerohalosphaeraceae bacterium]